MEAQQLPCKGEEIISLCCLTFVVSGEKVCAQHSRTADLTELDSQSILTCFGFLSQSISFKVTTECDRDQHSLMQSSSSSLSDRSLNTNTRTPSERFFAKLDKSSVI